MSKAYTLSKFGKSSPFWFISIWSLILLANFLPAIPQPLKIVGYLWKVEFALAALILFTLVFAIKFQRGKTAFIKLAKLEIYWIILPLFLFTVWSGLSMIWAASWRNALHHTLLWACYGLFYILVRQIIAKPRLLDFSLKLTGLVMLILAVTCSVEYFSNFGAINGFFTFRYYKYAEALVTLLPIYLALALKLKSRSSVIAGAVAFMSWLVVLLSLSRAVFIAGFICITLFFTMVTFFYGWKPHLKKSFLLISLFSCAIFITQTLSSTAPESSTFKRFSSNERSQSNLDWRFMMWGFSLKIFEQSPFNGIGADNFVVDYRTTREIYSVAYPESKLLEIDETVLPERAHNEYLQILAELGIVGAVFFGWFLFGIVRLFLSVDKKSVSLLSIAGFTGIFAFLLNSLASSYSFRVPANGVCFFFLVALLVQGLPKVKKNEKGKQIDFDLAKSKFVFIWFGLVICILMLIFSAARGISLMYLQFAFASTDESEVRQNYQKAIAIDNEDGSLRYYYGMQLYNWKNPEEAIPQIRFGIDNGIATSATYFNLASAQITARHLDQAERTFVESLRVYPRSVFLRTAYAFFLKENGKNEQSNNEYEKALQINPNQAKSWWTAQNEGMTKLTQSEYRDKTFVQVMDLKPEECVFALLDSQRQNRPDLVQK